MGNEPPPTAPPGHAEPKPCQSCVKGDYYTCPCPHCGAKNQFLTAGMKIQQHVPHGFKFTCPHCKREAWYWATLQIQITSDKAAKK